MILLCQIFLIQLLSGLCGGFGWLGFSAYTTRKPRTAKPYRPVVYETPDAEVFGHQPYQPSMKVYTDAQPYRSLFSQGYTTIKPEPTTENPKRKTTIKPELTTTKPKLTNKKPQLDVADPLAAYPSPVSQIHVREQSYSEPAAYVRQPVVTNTRPLTSNSPYLVTARPTAYTRPPVSVTITTRSTISRGSYLVTTRPPAAYRRQPVTVTTTRPTTTRGSYEVTIRPQYEPVGSSTQGTDYEVDSNTVQYPPICHIEKKVEFQEQCENYKEETCNTFNKERCSSQVLKDCTPVLRTKVEEVCQNVTNQICTLVESEEKVQVEEVIFISKCSRVMQQVCDERYGLEVTDQEQEVCVDLETVDCTQETITVLDTECVEGAEFYCQQDVYKDRSGCEKISTDNCTNIPRQVTVSSCQSTSTLCLNFTSQQAVPIMTEVCHDQQTVVCRVVEDVMPMARRVYTYSVSCDMKEKEECKLVEKVKLETSCAEKKIPVCEHHLGEEECVEVDKEFCHQVEKVIEVEVCDDEKPVSSLQGYKLATILPSYKPVTIAPRYKPVIIVPSYKPVTFSPSYKPGTFVPSYKPVTSVPSYKPVTSMPSYKPVTSMPSYKPVTSMPSYKPVTSLPSYKPVTSVPSYKPVTSVPSYKPVTTVPSYKPVTIASSYKPVTSVPSYKPVTIVPSYKLVTSVPSYKPVTIVPSYKPVTSLPGYKPVTSLPSYKPVESAPSYEPVTSLPGYMSMTSLAPQYEPVTTTPSPSRDYEALASGILPYDWYSSAKPSKQDDSENTSSTPPLPVLADYKPVLSLGFMERSFPKTSQSLPFCHTEEKVEFLEQCENYKEETCNTLNKEKCSSQVLNDCRPVLKTRVEEVCQNVTNKLCTLVESEENIIEEEVIYISSCSRAMEQVCDERYELEVKDQENEVCVELETVDCIQETITVTDSVCVEGVEFNCQENVYMEKSECEKIIKDNCTSIPRQVTVSSCQSTSTLCLNLTSQQAVPIMTEVCHDQQTIECKVVKEVKPVEKKVYTYSVSCDTEEKEECKLMEKVKLETSCNEKKRPVCEHHLGEEECVEVDKEFCHQVEKVVEVEVCDDEFQTYEI